MIRLIIADDHAIVRKGLRQLFQLYGDLTVVGEAENQQQLMDFLRDEDISLLLLDLSMPGMGGPDIIAQILASHPTLHILVLSMHNEPQIVSRTLKAGASGYLTKDNDPETLIAAIRKVANGGRFIDPKLVELLVFDFSQPDQKASHDPLSEREFQVLEMLANGKGINEIAAELHLSNKTVSTHKTHLLQKLKLNNLAELIRYYDALDRQK